MISSGEWIRIAVGSTHHTAIHHLGPKEYPAPLTYLMNIMGATSSLLESDTTKTRDTCPFRSQWGPPRGAPVRAIVWEIRGGPDVRIEDPGLPHTTEKWGRPFVQCTGEA